MTTKTINLNLRKFAPTLARKGRGGGPAIDKSQFGRTMLHASARGAGLTDAERTALGRVGLTGKVPVELAPVAMAVFQQAADKLGDDARGDRHVMRMEWLALSGVIETWFEKRDDSYIYADFYTAYRRLVDGVDAEDAEDGVDDECVMTETQRVGYAARVVDIYTACETELRKVSELGYRASTLNHLRMQKRDERSLKLAKLLLDVLDLDESVVKSTAYETASKSKT